MSIYINSIAHISIQEPMSENWFHSPIMYRENYVRSIEPDYSAFIPMMTARRMGLVMKRAIATALKTIRETGIENPDAIITGTGLGCIENTEKFLIAMIENNEELLPPTAFMQSTHNTIGSQIAVFLKCNGYNSTYSHRGTSFDSALFDAVMQFELEKISSALINSHDEMTPNYFKLLSKLNYWKEGEISEEVLRDGKSKGSFSSEASVSFMLENSKSKNTICELKGMEMMYEPDIEQIEVCLNKILRRNNLNINNINAVVVGVSGDKDNDDIYTELLSSILPQKPVVWYKHIFGESYSASGLGMYVAATILKKGILPKHLLYSKTCTDASTPQNILVYNHFQNKDHSLVLLSSCNN
ncbi:beta-ketoacyl synthase chain length factor [Odoribacter sp. OttesenSCG-928-L07]|nr:beta-ketoacyl synthase chain length factor [Odoribacter sp. OttesenSCG-928-L07]MDL2238895.1 beta-ketoacyl synthase chain length factor [Bacteroidales bacterium OttesenSCG-928-L14]MDL2240635.1 beta-ketoacyl synthase chain length factor [Bacteroidales bacterium OttesenSCG-928-K22]